MKRMERSMARENRTHHERMWMTVKGRTQLGLEPCGACAIYDDTMT